MKSLGVCIIALIVSTLSVQTIAQPGGGNPPNQPTALGQAPVPVENPITESKRVLGKILFWDEQLSSDNSVACGTCHKPVAGGADSRLAINPGLDSIFGTADDVIGSPGMRSLDANGLQLNHPLFGHSAQVTNRATPSFFTSMFADSNFWDGRASDQFVDPLNPTTIVIESGGALESQALGPILNTVEMAQQDRDWVDVIAKLSQIQPLALAMNIPADMADALQGIGDYPTLFNAAFGDEQITPVRIAFAIATYERTLVPNQTPWDAFIGGDANAMTADQIAGWDAFTQTTCGNCHRPPLFTDNNFRNIGLRPAGEDLGEFVVTNNTNDRGNFKTPSLRNAGIRKALMHVGWVTDVADALDFYNSGTNDTGHTQFTQDQSGIPNSNLDIDEINVFGNDPVRRAQVIDFIANGLTDSRVAKELYPFDRPTLASEFTSASELNLTPIPGSASNSLPTTASFLGSVTSDSINTTPGRFSVFESLAINMQINVAEQDRNRSGNLYCVIGYGNRLYALNGDNEYNLWDGNPASLPSSRSVAVLGAIQQLSIIERFTQTSGLFDIYVGYDTDDGVIRYNSAPLQFIVQ